MADFTPTESQRQAVEDRGGSLLVSAAAGSGKTRVLTERLMSYLTDRASPRSIDSFLVITFSRAAAAELRSRITDELAKKVAADPSAAALRRQSALAAGAPIGTIHSFCSSLLREYGHSLGLPPDFAVADEDRVTAIRASALEKVMEEAYVRADPDFLLLSDTVGAGRDDARLSALVLTLHSKLQCHARPREWAEAQITVLRDAPSDAGETVWGRALLAPAKDSLLYWESRMQELLALISAPEYEYIMNGYGDSLIETRSQLAAAAAQCDRGWEALRAALPITFPRLGTVRKPQHPEITDRVKDRRAACHKAMDKLAVEFADSSDSLLRDLSLTAPAMEALLRLVLRFDERFTADKLRRGLLDFSDLEHQAARLLTEPDGSSTDTAREVSARFTEVMVDEYQDVSRVQELIIRAVSDEGRKLFMVGDVKQSVYRFRLADPTIFIEKYLSYAPAETAGPGQPRRVLLRENFRSRTAVLDAVNAVFRNIMSTKLGELEYDDGAALRPGLPSAEPSPVPELLALRLPDAGDDGERPDKVAAEAAFTAGRISALIASGVTVEEGGARRPLRYGDIAILLRSANVSGPVYRRELGKLGIPVEASRSGGFFRSPEVTVMMSLLAVIDNPRQDVPLIAVLRSALFGFTADDLTAVRLCDAKADFYTALLASAETLPKSRDFLELLTSLRRFAADTELDLLIREIYARLDVFALCCALPDGSLRRENLALLAELAHSFERSGWRGLRRFLLWLRSRDERGEEPSGSSGEGNAVSIMSVHRSKGLEFPVVFLCDTSREFNKQDSNAAVLVHPELGLGPKLTDASRGIEYPTLARRAIARRLRSETLSEELRLLYVAMTRARERLYITCAMPDPQAVFDAVSSVCDGGPVPPQELEAMSCPARWLMAAVAADGEKHLRLSFCTPEDHSAVIADDEAAVETVQTPDGLIDALDWRCPRSAAAGIPSKISATEVKSLGASDAESGSLLPETSRVFREPELSGKARRLTAAERGTAAHLALRYLDFARADSASGISAELERMVEAGLISRREADAVDVSALLSLFSSPTGQRMRACGRVLREFPFTLLCPAEKFFPGAEDEELLLQGVVDCCLDEPDGLVLIDYKTDAVQGDRVAKRAAKYAPQLLAYSWALSRITGRPVKERVLFFLRPGESVVVPDSE